MDYYDKKIKARALVLKLKNEGATTEEIYKAVFNTWGMGKKIVDQIIEMI